MDEHLKSMREAWIYWIKVSASLTHDMRYQPLKDLHSINKTQLDFVEKQAQSFIDSLRDDIEILSKTGKGSLEAVRDQLQEKYNLCKALMQSRTDLRALVNMEDELLHDQNLWG